MSYVRAFFGFWRKFIVGDDSRIAVVIMWTILLVDSLVLNFMNSWFVLPVVVILLLSFLIYDATSDKAQSSRRRPAALLVTGTLPMIVVCALPLLLSRTMAGVWDAQYTLVPLCIYVIIGSIVTASVGWLLRPFPVLSVCIIGIVSFALITYWQVAINQFSQHVVATHSTPIVAFSVIVLVGFVAGAYKLLARR